MIDTTANRLRTYMDMHNLKQVDVLNLAQPYCEMFNTKLNKSDLSQFLNGKVKPGQLKLAVLGKALNVSEAWLMGLDVPMERVEEKPAPNDGNELDELEKSLLVLLKQLTPEQKKFLLVQMQTMLRQDL